MAFFELRTPQDILQKAKREHGRLKANFDIDNVFNFFVTANHIRDYIKKNDVVAQAVLEEFLKDQDMKDCCDLCDKAKHLRFTKRNRTDSSKPTRTDPLTHRWRGAYGSTPFGVLPYGMNSEWELWYDDRKVNIKQLADRVIVKWDQFFSSHGL